MAHDMGYFLLWSWRVPFVMDWLSSFINNHHPIRDNGWTEDCFKGVIGTPLSPLCGHHNMRVISHVLQKVYFVIFLFYQKDEWT